MTRRSQCLAQLLGGGEQRDPVGSGWARGGACPGKLPCPGGPCPGCVALAGGHQAGHGPAAAPPERLRGAWGSVTPWHGAGEHGEGLCCFSSPFASCVLSCLVVSGDDSLWRGLRGRGQGSALLQPGAARLSREVCIP